ERHALRLEREQCVVQSVRLRAFGACTLVVATTTDAVHALGDVHYLEVGTECTHQCFGFTRRTAGQLRAQRNQRRLAFTACDGGGAHVFHFIEEAGRNLFGKKIADQRAEAAHIVAQWQVGSGKDYAATVLVHRRRTSLESGNASSLTEKTVGFCSAPNLKQLHLNVVWCLSVQTARRGEIALSWTCVVMG